MRFEMSLSPLPIGVRQRGQMPRRRIIRIPHLAAGGHQRAEAASGIVPQTHRGVVGARHLDELAVEGISVMRQSRPRLSLSHGQT